MFNWEFYLDKNNIISLAFENIKFIVLTDDYDKKTFNFTEFEALIIYLR